MPITSNQQKKLQKFESQIVKLSKKNHSLAKRKQILSGGSFMKTLLDESLPPLVDSILTKAKK